MFDSKPNLSIFDQSKDIPDLTGKVFLVTGGNAGLGEATVEAIAKNGGKVYMASRTESKAQDAITRLRASSPTANVEYLPLDLADLHSVQTCAETFLRKEPSGKLNVLVNNAGIMLTPVTWETKDGFEAQFGTNVVGHYYLTELLLPALEKAAKVDGESRVVNLSSGAAWANWWGFKVDAKGKCGMSGNNYVQSKWCNAIHAKMLARRWEQKGIKAYSVHPGMILTDLYVPLSKLPIIGKIAHWCSNKIAHLTVAEGAHTILYAALAQNIRKEDNGGFIIPGTTFGRKPMRLDDPKAQEELGGYLIEKLNEKGFKVEDWRTKA